MSYGDIVGRLLNVMSNEGHSRLEHVANSSQPASSQAVNKWWGLIEKFLHTRQVGNVTGGQLGGIGALAGALLSGGATAATGALGGSALSMLGALAINALKKKYGIQSPDLEEKELIDSLPKEDIETITAAETEKLILQAMINAAKADGQLDQSEMDKLMGKVGEDGITEEERQFIRDELNQTLDLTKLTSSVPNQVVATQVYAASLFAIDIDTEAEKNYLRRLAQALHLDSDTVKRLHELTASPMI